jgi:hypothetical protein
MGMPSSGRSQVSPRAGAGVNAGDGGTEEGVGEGMIVSGSLAVAVDDEGVGIGSLPQATIRTKHSNRTTIKALLDSRYLIVILPF